MTWQLDPNHSSLNVSTKHMMVTTVRGKLAIVDVALDFDPEHPERSSVEATIDAASIDTGAEGRDQHLRSPDFLDVATYPTITFRSTRIEPAGARYRLRGDLTLRGVTRPIVLDATIDGVVADMRGGQRASFHATTRINRDDWGLGWNVALEAGGWLVGKELGVEIDLAATEVAAELVAGVAQKTATASAA